MSLAISESIKSLKVSMMNVLIATTTLQYEYIGQYSKMVAKSLDQPIRKRKKGEGEYAPFLACLERIGLIEHNDLNHLDAFVRKIRNDLSHHGHHTTIMALLSTGTDSSVTFEQRYYGYIKVFYDSAVRVANINKKLLDDLHDNQDALPLGWSSELIELNLEQLQTNLATYEKFIIEITKSENKGMKKCC